MTKDTPQKQSNIQDDKKQQLVQKKIISPKLIAWNTVKNNVASIRIAVDSKDKNTLRTVAKHSKKLRSQLQPELLKAAVASYIPPTFDAYKLLLLQIDSVEDVKMEDVEDDDKEQAEQNKIEPLSLPEDLSDFNLLPEVEVYLSLLVFYYVLDQSSNKVALKTINMLIETLSGYNRRTLDYFSAKIFFYFSLVNERNRTLSEIRPKLLELYRTCSLRHDEPSKAVLHNCILRSYIYNLNPSYDEKNPKPNQNRYRPLYNAAMQFNSLTKFPESHSNYQYGRYLFYTGKIALTNLEYSSAHEKLSAALRRAPQTFAKGFREECNKLLIVCSLLMGDIPSREIFTSGDLTRSLAPYMEICKAVRVGDLIGFTKAQKEYASKFINDGTFNLITRLRHNVINAALRKIHESYSRISIQDVAERLGLDYTDCEYVLAKSINSGVMDARINREEKYVESNIDENIYMCEEPMNQYHNRIMFCLNIHNKAIKSMRYPEISNDNEEKEN